MDIIFQNVNRYVITNLVQNYYDINLKNIKFVAYKLNKKEESEEKYLSLALRLGETRFEWYLM